MGTRSSYSYYKITWMIRYIKNTNICVERDTIPFVGISILGTHMTWILLTQVQEIISPYGLEFAFMSGFGTIEMWRYGIWDYYLLPIRES